MIVIIKEERSWGRGEWPKSRFQTSEPGALRPAQSLLYPRSRNRIQRETAVAHTQPDGPTPSSREPRQHCPELTVKLASTEARWSHRPRGHILSWSCLCCALKRKFLLWQLGHPGPSKQPHRREEPTSCFLSGSRKSHFTESFGGPSLMI